MPAIGLRRSAAARPTTAPGGPSDRALDKLAGRAAIALRLSSAVTCSVVGPLAATAGVSAAWLAIVITVLWGWSAAFAWRVYRSGLSRALVLADIAVIAAIVATQRHVVPAGLTADGTTWILPLASTAIYISLLALRPVIGLPALARAAAARPTRSSGPACRPSRNCGPRPPAARTSASTTASCTTRCSPP
jgi:hypothetical protein